MSRNSSRGVATARLRDAYDFLSRVALRVGNQSLLLFTSQTVYTTNLIQLNSDVHPLAK